MSLPLNNPLMMGFPSVPSIQAPIANSFQAPPLLFGSNLGQNDGFGFTPGFMPAFAPSFPTSVTPMGSGLNPGFGLGNIGNNPFSAFRSPSFRPSFGMGVRPQQGGGIQQLFTQLLSMLSSNLGTLNNQNNLDGFGQNPGLNIGQNTAQAGGQNNLLSQLGQLLQQPQNNNRNTFAQAGQGTNDILNQLGQDDIQVIEEVITEVIDELQINPTQRNNNQPQVVEEIIDEEIIVDEPQQQLTPQGEPIERQPDQPVRPNSAPQNTPRGENTPTEDVIGMPIDLEGGGRGNVEIEEDDDDPLLLDVAGTGVKLTNANNGVSFDLNGDGNKEQTAWTEANGDNTNGFLALDSGEKGITSGKELFGDQFGDANGFERLKQFDDNNDGMIDSKDAVYQDLEIWQDKNHDGISQADEMVSLADAGVANINLNYDATVTRDENGNGLQSGEFTRADGSTGDAANAWFSKA